jgi:hypothetical protein
MIAALHYFQDLLGRAPDYAINEPVLIGDAPRPPSGKRTLERLGLAKSLEWVASNVFDQSVYLDDDVKIVQLPV